MLRARVIPFLTVVLCFVFAALAMGKAGAEDSGTGYEPAPARMDKLLTKR
jgi:hypothetical protein